MLKAGKIGDHPALQYLYQAYGAQQESRLIWSSFETEDGPPPTYELITAAIIQEYVPIVAYFLSMHPEGNIGCDQIVWTIIDYPNIKILKLFQSHTPGIVNFEFNPSQTFLTEACRGDWQYDSPTSDMTLALTHYLLDNRADPREGSWNGCGALYSALEFSRPLDIYEQDDS